MIAQVFSEKTAKNTRIMYGGSVKGHNVEKMIEGRDIDGVGAGSGSLNIEDFLEIARGCSDSEQVQQMSFESS